MFYATNFTILTLPISHIHACRSHAKKVTERSHGGGGDRFNEATRFLLVSWRGDSDALRLGSNEPRQSRPTLGDNFRRLLATFLSLWVQSRERTSHDDIRESPRRKGRRPWLGCYCIGRMTGVFLLQAFSGQSQNGFAV
jgi:hypothetical protein